MKFVLFTYKKKDLIGGVITKNNKQSFKLKVYELNNKTQFDYPFTGHFEKRYSLLNKCIKSSRDTIKTFFLIIYLLFIIY